MLQGLRDNLKGTVAVFVLVVFVVPLVMFGVEELFVGPAAVSDAATVNGDTISGRDFQRELGLEKQRLQQQFKLEPNSPQLEDSALSGPVLQRLVQRKALYQAAEEAGMGASKELLWKQIAKIEAFRQDGKFNEKLFKERISFAYTPATFLEASAEDFVLRHLNSGVESSGFVTASDLAVIASITKQKRSFFTIDVVPSAKSVVTVTDAEIDDYYAKNGSEFKIPEAVTVDYLELTLEGLAKLTVVSDADIKAAYEAEVADFKAAPKLTVAHILVEGDKPKVVQEISSKLAEKSDFAQLAKEYSDDLGSKNQGGNLGILVEDAFPSAFLAAANKLNVGETSGPVKTDSGVHFIRLLDKANVAPPTFEERKEAIQRTLARQAAQDDFVTKVAKLEETTFGADNLAAAGGVLGLTVQTSSSFTAQGGAGIAANSDVVKAAFEDDVLNQGHNSRVIEVAGERAYVIRLKEHSPESVRPLAEVKQDISKQLQEQKQAALLAQQAQELRANINAGGTAQALAKDAGFEYKFNDGVERTAAGVNNMVLQKAFSLPRPEAAVVLDQVSLPAGGVVVIGLQKVEDGSSKALEPEQLAGLKRQLTFQLSQGEMRAFENAVIEKAKVVIAK